MERWQQMRTRISSIFGFMHEFGQFELPIWRALDCNIIYETRWWVNTKCKHSKLWLLCCCFCSCRLMLSLDTWFVEIYLNFNVWSPNKRASHLNNLKLKAIYSVIYIVSQKEEQWTLRNAGVGAKCKVRFQGWRLGLAWWHGKVDEWFLRWHHLWMTG